MPPGTASADHAGATLDLRVEHLLWAIAALCLFAAAVASSPVWLVVAVLAGAAGAVAASRGVEWPSEIHVALARRGLTAPRGSRRAPTDGPPRSDAPPTPLRPMTVTELFGGAAKVLARHWPTLLGVPAAALLCAAGAGALIGMVAVQALAVTVTEYDSALAAMAPLLIAFYVAVPVVAFVLDVAMLGLSIAVTDQAVRGRAINLGAALRRTRRLVGPLARLMLLYYALTLLPNIVLFAMFGLFVTDFGAVIAVTAIGCAALFVANVAFSLSPMVLVVEGLGAAASLRRGFALAKPVLGRILAVHLLYVCAATMLLWIILQTEGLGIVLLVAVLVTGFAVVLASLRCLQVMIYTDVRMREGSYAEELRRERDRHAV